MIIPDSDGRNNDSEERVEKAFLYVNRAFGCNYCPCYFDYHRFPHFSQSSKTFKRQRGKEYAAFDCAV